MRCGNCGTEFDAHEPERLRVLQRLEDEQQLKLWQPELYRWFDYRDPPVADLYDTPWEDEPHEVWFCSEDCEQGYCYSGFGSFQYVWCDGCERQICEQNPRNGWHVQFRDLPNWGYVCLRCYEGEILEHGQPREDFERAGIRGGMFFDLGNPEPRGAGYHEVAGFQDYPVRSGRDAELYNRCALHLIDGGHQVLTAYERMAIGGLEGYLTMFAKPGEDA